MRSLCIYDAQQQRTFILIQYLHVGGAIQAEYGQDKNIVQWDNGLILTNLKNNTDILASLAEVVVRYASADDVVASLLETHIVQSIIYQKQDYEERLCYVQQEITRIHHWMTNTFPSSSTKWIHHAVGVTVNYAGAALQVHRCSQLYDYQAICDKKMGDTCYLDFPVKNLQSNQTHFLSSYDRQLKAASAIINCKDRLFHTYIKGKYQKFHLITASGKITEVILQSDTVVGLEDFMLKKIQGYSKRFQKPRHTLNHIQCWKFSPLYLMLLWRVSTLNSSMKMAIFSLVSEGPLVLHLKE